MFGKIIAQQKELQNELAVTTKKIEALNKQLTKLEDKAEIKNRIENIERLLTDFDTKQLKYLNGKIDALRSTKNFFKWVNRLVILIVFLSIVFVTVFLLPCSPIYQKTRQQELLNDILEKHFTELYAEDDAIKAVDQCKKILEEWERKQETAKEESHE